MKGNVFNQKCIKVSHSGEVLFWLVILLLIVIISTVTKVFNSQNDNDYTLFMPDVDGLIVGSPVRMMGIDVGYITKIKPFGDEVYVKFLIPNKELVLPQGTVVTVEFSGMAGSKSLELYLPNGQTYVDENTPFLNVESPIRLNEAAGLFDEMMDKVGSIIYNSTSFGKKLDFIELNIDKSLDLQGFVKQADKVLDDSKSKIDSRKAKNRGGEFYNGTK